MSKRALRFSSIGDMPRSMQEAARIALERDGARVLGIDKAKDGTTTAASGVRLDDGTVVITGVDTITPRRANKYGNTVTHVDGIRFDSKREARYYEQLKLRKAAGEVSYWLRQVAVHLPGGTRYVVDFLVFFADGRHPEYVDVKGRETKEFRIKKREVEHHYPFRVVLA